LTVEVVEFAAALKDQKIILATGSHNICTKFCSGSFLQYHQNESTGKFNSSFLAGEINQRRFVLPYSWGGDSSIKITSHIGSPYAGLCISSDSPDLIKQAYHECVETLKQEFKNIMEIEIRLPPTILSKASASHEWALWSLGFKPTTMYYGRYFEESAKHFLNRNRKRRISRIEIDRMRIESTNIPSADVFDVILSNRQNRHSVKPTHNLQDLEAIEDLLPGTLKTYYVIHDGAICSVAIIFQDQLFSTIQYLGGLECSFNCGSQDVLVQKIVETYTGLSQKLLFGTSTEPSEGHRTLNQGLDQYKESFGPTGYTASRMALIIP
jgi:hypothetical protein